MGWRETLVSWIPNPLVRLFAGPYIAGNSLESALEVADALWRGQGLQATLDLLGEGIRERNDIETELQEYLRILDTLESGEHISVSLKPTQLGLAIDPALCRASIETLLSAAQTKGIMLTLDMEESDYTTATLELYRELRQRYDNVGTVLQSRLYRTADDIPTYLRGLNAHIRLCIGIYREPPAIAYTDKRKMKESFLPLARTLWEEGHFVAIATHDVALLRRCLALAEEMGIPQERYEVQMLLGVPRHDIQQELRRKGIPVRLYVPYGITWDHAYAYARRRLIENPSIGLYVARNLPKKLWNWLTGKQRRTRRQLASSDRK